jgi:hypothetical protein
MIAMNGYFKIIVLTLSLSGLSLWYGNAYAVTCTSTGTGGNWNAAGTWTGCGGGIPATNDDVIISAGATVSLNANTNALASLTVNTTGTLSVPTGGNADIYIKGNITNNGTINMQSSTGVNTIYLVGAGITSILSGTGTWLLDNIDMNGNGGALACTGACTVEIIGSPYLQFSNATPLAAATTTRTFNALGNSTATVEVNLAGTQTLSANGVSYPNLVLAGSGTKNIGTGNNQTINVLGTLTINSGVTLSTTRTGMTIQAAQDFTNNGTFTGTNISVVFNGAIAQFIGGTSTTTFSNLTIASTGVGSTTLLRNSAVTGNLSVNSGTLFLSNFTANRTAAGGTITVANGSTLDIGGTNSFPANYTTHAIGATSTVVYSGTNQSVAAEGAPGYGNLTLSGSGTKTMPAAAQAVRGNLTMSGTASAAAGGALTIGGGFVLGSGTTFNAGVFSHSVAGDFTNNGATFSASSSTITLNGASAQLIGGTAASTFNNLTINNTSGVTLGNSQTVSGVLTLTNGILTTGSNIMEVTSSCTTGISGGGATYVVGNLTLHYPTNAGTTTCTFPIGSAAAYSPATIAMLNVTSTLATSSLTARTDTPDHPDTAANISGVDPAKSVNRFWTLTPGGSLTFATYNTTFTFVAGDIDGGATSANFIIARKSSGIWRYPTMGAKNPLNTTASGMTQAGGFGVFVIGERSFPSITTLKTVRAYWDPFNGTIDPLVFVPNAKNIPGAIAEYTIISSNSAGPADYDSTFITDPIPVNTKLFVNDIGGGGSGPVLFTQGATSSTLTYTFAALNSPADDLAFSNDGGTTFTATPSFDALGCDNTVPAITHIRVSPKGAFIGSGAPNPSFQLRFRVCVK